MNKEDRERERGRRREGERDSWVLSVISGSRANGCPGTAWHKQQQQQGSIFSFPIFQKELFITPPAKYNKGRWGGGWRVTTCPCVKVGLKRNVHLKPTFGFCFTSWLERPIECNYNYFYFMPFLNRSARAKCNQVGNIAWLAENHRSGWVN